MNKSIPYQYIYDCNKKNEKKELKQHYLHPLIKETKNNAAKLIP